MRGDGQTLNVSKALLMHTAFLKEPLQRILKKGCLRNNLCGQVEPNSLLVQSRKIPVNGAAFFYTDRNTCQLNWQKLK